MAEGGKLTSPVGKVKNAGIPGFGPGCGILWSLYWECLGLPLFFAHFSWLFPWVFSWNSLKIQVFNLVGFFFFKEDFFFPSEKDLSQERGIPYMFASHKTARIGREAIFLPNFPIVCRDFFGGLIPSRCFQCLCGCQAGSSCSLECIRKGSSF